MTNDEIDEWCKQEPVDIEPVEGEAAGDGAGPIALEAETFDPADKLETFQSSGAPKQTLSNCVAMLEADPAMRGKIRRNLLSDRIHVTLPLPLPGYDGEGERVIDRRERNEFECYFNERYGLVKKEAIHTALEMVADRNEFDPLREALEALPPWDGVERAGHLMHWFLGAPNDAYTQAVGRLFFGAVIMRAFHPGCKFDLVPVLLGAQGIGKSTFARLAALRDDWFSDTLMGIGTGEGAHMIQGATVIEISELAGFKGRSLENVKSFITRREDRYRVPYDPDYRNRPRRCVFIGTTNDGQFLHDQTGNRRFLPVRCGEVAPQLDLFADDARSCFEQAYAELLHEYRESGAVPLTLPREVEGDAEAARQAVTVEDDRIDAIRDWLEEVKPGTAICTRQLAEEACGLEIPKGAKQELKEIREIIENNFPELERQGDKKKIPGYGTQRVYIKRW